MAKKPRVRTLMGSQHVKGFKTLLKSARQYFCHIFWSLWNKTRSTNSVLVWSGILRLFLNILTPDEKYSLSVKAKVYRTQFKWRYLKIKKYFLNFFLHLQNLHKILNTLEKKKSLRGSFFLKLCTAKRRVTKIPKKPSVRTLMGNQHAKGSKTLVKNARQYFCLIFWSPWNKIRLKISVLLLSRILRLFVNILTPHEKYSLSVKPNV